MNSIFTKHSRLVSGTRKMLFTEYRISRHFNYLAANSHEVEELQNEWNRYEREGCPFRVVESDPSWETKTARTPKDSESITQCHHSVYNKDPVRASQNVRKNWTCSKMVNFEKRSDTCKLSRSCKTIKCLSFTNF